MKQTIPQSVFNSKALFNPYQYLPFQQVFEKKHDRYLWNGTNLLITDEVGVGKTFEAGIILKELLHNDLNLSVLILSPVKLCENWQTEMDENFKFKFHNYTKTKCKGQLTILPYSYFASASRRFEKNKEEEAVLEEILKEEQKKSEADIKRETLEKLSASLLDHCDVLILDEAHYLRNRGFLWHCVNHLINKREESVEIKQFRMFMTATPIFNDNDDRNNLEELITVENPNFVTTTTLQGEANCYDFNLEIALRLVENDQVEATIFSEIYNGGFRGLTGFLKRVSASSIYTLKKFLENRADFHQTLEGTDFDVEDETDTEEWMESEGLDKFYTPELEERLKVLQIHCNQWTQVSDSKYQVLSTLVNNIMNRELSSHETRGIVIFSSFLNTCDYLKTRLGEQYKVYTITGKTSPKQLNTEINNFKNSVQKGEKAILISSDAGKEGHNFQFCQHIIHYDFPFTPAAMGQRNGRIYRRGQQGKPKAYYIAVNGSYDDRLVGQIIAYKSQIVRRAAENGKVSFLNVLPMDNTNYLKHCLQVYFDDIVKLKYDKKIEQLRRKAEEYDYKKIFHETQKEEFRRQLLKKFSEMKNKKRSWLSTEIECLHRETNSDFTEVFVAIFSNFEKNDTLQETYRVAYQKQEDSVNQYFFGKSTKKHLLENFNQFTVGYDTKFCDYMLSSGTSMSFDEYKAQFQPMNSRDKKGDKEE